MRVNGTRLLIPVAVLLSLSVPGLSAAQAAVAPTPQRITGVVQTIIREHPQFRPDAGSADTGDHDSTNLADTTGTGTDGSGTGEPASPPVNDTSTALRVGNSLVPLTAGSLPGTRNGSTVSVTVVPGADGAKSVVSARTLAAPPVAAIPSVHHVYVALVVPAGVSADPSLTQASVRAMVGTVSAFWSSQTGNQVSFDTVRVLPAYRSAYGCGLSDNQAEANTTKMWTEARAKMPEAAGTGRHLVLVAPASAYDHNCFYGLGTIGALSYNGNDVFVSGLTQSLLAHELGHNLGLYHSNGLRCAGAQDRPVVDLAFAGCEENEYDDLFDVMGYSGRYYGEGNLNAVHLDGMGLLPAAVRKIPAASGITTARIAPLSTSAAGRTLKITDSGGASYFVEYRTDSGRDRRAAFTYYKPAWGVRVLRDNPAAPPSAGSYELDTSPSGLDLDYNRALRVGDTFTAASRRVTIKVDRQDSSGATVTIADWATRIVPYTAALSVRGSAHVGSAIAAATRVTDRHGSAVAGWAVTLQKRQQGTSTWRAVRSLRTGTAGTASYRFANGVSGTYRWLTVAVSGAPVRTSPWVTVTSTAKIVERRPARSMARRTYLSVHGVISAVPSPVVHIQYRYGAGPWHTGPRASVSGTVVSGRIAINIRTTVSTRLYVRSSTSYRGSVSGSYSTAVR